MRTVILKPEKIEGWSSFFTTELISCMEDQDFHMVGAEFLEEPAGLITWKENGDEAEILSIFVDAGARRLGIGTELLQKMLELMSSGIKTVFFGYTDEDEHSLLTPFFERFGAQIEASVYPLGLFTVGEAVKKMEEMAIMEAKDCSFGHFSVADKNLLYHWIEENTELDPKIYMESTPGFAIIRENKVKAVLLMRDVEDTVYLDYLWGEDSAFGTMELLSAFHDYLVTLTDHQDRLVHMILATEHSKTLYRRLLGKPQNEITLCRGFFEPELIGDVYDRFVIPE